MEYALTADHHRVHALDAEKGQEYYCPVCGNQVIPRQGEVNSWHFAHVTSCVDDWKYDMSEWHRNWQNRFPESTREVVIEYKGESHRADILTGGYVIEFQHSPITSTEFERRNLFYTKAGYKVIWVFDETEAYANEYIIGSGDNCDKFVWKWPNRVLASVVPQRSTDIAVVLQLTEDHDDDGCEWLVKVEWAIVDDDGYADYRRFFIDDGFAPDLFTEDGLQNILLSKRKRFDAFLRDNQPYAPKCSRIKGNPRDWYICPKTHDWHNNQCRECQNNLIKVEPTHKEVSAVTTSQCKLKPTSMPPADKQEWKAIRKIPDWAAAPNQNNHRIIRAFLQLQKERGFVCRPELEARCQDPEGHADVYVRDFRGNFTSMKTDAGKSHGKVFRDDGYNITICTEVLATLEQYRSLFEA